MRKLPINPQVAAFLFDPATYPAARDFLLVTVREKHEATLTAAREYMNRNGDRVRAERKSPEARAKQREYYAKAREATRAGQKAYHWRTREIRLQKMREYTAANYEAVKAKQREYHAKNKERCNQISRDYHKKHAAELSKKHTIRQRERRKNDPEFACSCRLRRRLLLAIRSVGVTKTDNTHALLGCTPRFLKEHLEKQFVPGMSWENRHKWHIDHIIPCAAFNLSDPEQQKACFHYTNLQPLWAKDNIRKGAKLPHEFSKAA